MGLWRQPRLCLLCYFFLCLLLSGQCLDFRGLPWSGKASRHRIAGPIKTVVVVMMENRSFDHMLGWLRASRPDIDGLTGRESNRLNASDPASPEVFVSADAAYIDSDPGHSFEAIREQIFGSEDTSADTAPVNGFVQQAQSEGLGMARTAMSGFPPESIPVYAALANEFAVFDRWFASVPTSTQPNRVFIHSATSHGLSSNVRDNLIRGLPQKTIFDSLDADGLTFGVYYQDIPAVLFLRRLRRLKYLGNFHSYRGAFRRHARRGTLPNYAVIEQHYFDSEWHPANDDHPSHDVSEGQKLIKEIYETLRASPQWNETALVITYDEHGGFYDHVPTPVRGVPNPDGIVGPAPHHFKFDRLGVRVPALVISPWIEKGTVVHAPDGPTPTSQYEHSSVPATVKKMFNLSSGFLTKRDAWAGSFENIFRTRASPRTDCPEKLPDVKKQLRPFGAAEGAAKALSGFQVELMQLASELTGEHFADTFKDVVMGMTAGEASRYSQDAVARFLDAGRAALRSGADASAFVEMRNGLMRTADSVWHYLSSSQ